MPTQPRTIRQSLWDPDDLIRRLGNNLELAERAVQLLAPLGFQDPLDPTVGVTAEKVIAETALFLLACRPVVGHAEELDRRMRRVAEALLPYARNEQLAIRLCLNPGLALDYAIAHLCLNQLGYPDPWIDQILRVTVTARTAGAHERPPHRMLEQRWLARLWNPADRDAHNDSGLARASLLGQSIDVFTASRDDCYALTHAMMYVSDLGERTIRLPRRKQRIVADVEAALACCLDRQDYDLCGELLLAWPYLRRAWSPGAVFAVRVLTRVEDAVGFLPAPLTRLDRYHALEGEERARYALASIYHTAYVMGILCAAILAHGPAAVSTYRRGSGVHNDDGLNGLMGNRSARPHWEEDFSNLDRRSQDALVMMRITIALQRAVAAGDFGLVRSLLAYSVEHHIAVGPAVQQAAELLRRLAALKPSERPVNAIDHT